MPEPIKRKLPQRKCLGCGESFDKLTLIRVVRSPVPEDSTEPPEISLDFKGKKPGRGAYICRNPDCLKKALKARRFDRALDVKLTEEIIAALTDQMKAGDGGG
ncbi:hypothetical protein FACS1894219_01660 [Clostridia bacterium]|nr:hypothetical protein FACS1894219_01660 [Clostridia bacterium]